MRPPAPLAVLSTGALVLAVGLPIEASATIRPPVDPPVVTSVVTMVGVRGHSQSVRLRFGTFNVRTSRADRGTARHWLRRVRRVARVIDREHPHVLALQELGPGRADGRRGKVGTSARQTDSLLRQLRRHSGRYRLVRTNAYAQPGSRHGTQGTRILYDHTRIRLVSRCPQRTGRRNYNSSCSMDLPRLKGDSAKLTRSAAYAQFEDRLTKRNFFVVSVHLDSRHSRQAKRERRYDALRRAQVRAVYRRVARRAHGKAIVLCGDLNSWKTKRGRDAPRDYLADRGFRDAVTAGRRIHDRYPTMNHFKPVLTPNAPGRQVALDAVLIKTKGKRRFVRYENRMSVRDRHRPSDHNLVLGDLRW